MLFISERHDEMLKKLGKEMAEKEQKYQSKKRKLEAQRDKHKGDQSHNNNNMMNLLYQMQMATNNSRNSAKHDNDSMLTSLVHRLTSNPPQHSPFTPPPVQTTFSPLPSNHKYYAHYYDAVQGPQHNQYQQERPLSHSQQPHNQQQHHLPHNQQHHNQQQQNHWMPQQDLKSSFDAINDLEDIAKHKGIRDYSSSLDSLGMLSQDGVETMTLAHIRANVKDIENNPISDYAAQLLMNITDKFRNKKRG